MKNRVLTVTVAAAAVFIGAPLVLLYLACVIAARPPSNKNRFYE